MTQSRAQGYRWAAAWVFICLAIIGAGTLERHQKQNRVSPCDCGNICKNAVTPCALKECPTGGK